MACEKMSWHSRKSVDAPAAPHCLKEPSQDSVARKSSAGSAVATAEVNSGTASSRSSSPGSKRGRDDEITEQEVAELAAVVRKLKGTMLRGDVNKHPRESSSRVTETEGTDFEWLCADFCDSA
jgi:hypothetical protein